MYNLGNALDRVLQMYSPEDGEYVDIVVMAKVFPTIHIDFWKRCILGLAAGDRAKPIKRLPLRGRKKTPFSGGSIRTVILMSSLEQWLQHYNPAQEKTVQEITDSLRKYQRQHDRKLHQLMALRILKRGHKLHGKKPPAIVD